MPRGIRSHAAGLRRRLGPSLPDRVGISITRGIGDKALYRLGVRSTSGLTLPDFLGIGAQKAGTTWLHANLERHPDLYLPTETKELHYFDTLWRQKSIADYAAFFAEAGARMKGEVTPAYALLPTRRIRAIRRLIPDLRLVLLLRDPVERAWSHACMYLLRGRRIEDVPESEFIAHFTSKPSRARGEYAQTIDRWTSIFPADRLLIGFHEELRDDPQGLLRRVFAHLGVRQDVDWGAFPVHEQILPEQQDRSGPAIPERHEAFLADLYREDLRSLAERFDSYATGWVR
jgi:hypothetical protein